MKCERSPLGLGVSSCIKHDKYRFGSVSGVIPCTVCGASVVAVDVVTHVATDVVIDVVIDVATDVVSGVVTDVASDVVKCCCH